MSQEPRYDFTIAVSRPGDPDCREQGTITNCPMSSLLLKSLVEHEFLTMLVEKLERRINPPAVFVEIREEMEFDGEITATTPGSKHWPPGNVYQEVA